MYFPRNWKFGSALSKRRNFGGEGRFEPRNPSWYATGLGKTSTQNCNISCRFELDIGFGTAERAVECCSFARNRWTNLYHHKKPVLTFHHTGKVSVVNFTATFLCFRKMEVSEGRQNLLKTAHIVKVVVSVHNTAMSLTFTVRCTRVILVLYDSHSGFRSKVQSVG
jgi:hypothetical protein